MAFAADETPAASDNAVTLYADYGNGFEPLSSLYFDKSVSEQTVEVEAPIRSLRVVKGDCYTLHLDRLTLEGICPVGYERKLSATDNDLIEIEDSADFALSGSGTLVIAARAPVELAGEEYSLKFPERNRLGVHPQSEFYSYTLGSHRGVISDDALAVPDKNDLFVSEMCYPDSGHPSAPIDFYVTDDDENLYVFFEAFVDNTLDHGKDFAGVHVKCGDTVKTYKAYTTDENEYGKWWFDYTDSSDTYDWEHMSYLVKLPLDEVEAKDSKLDLAFEYYGTVSLSDKLQQFGIGSRLFVTQEIKDNPWFDYPDAELLPTPGETKNAAGGTTQEGDWWLTNTGTTDAPAYTLTLNEASITETVPYIGENYTYLYANGSLTVVLAEGTTNTIGTRGTTVRYGMDVAGSKNFIIEGDGTLNSYASEHPYFSEGNLTVRGGATVNFVVDNTDVTKEYGNYAVGSFGQGSLTIDNASLSISCLGNATNVYAQMVALNCWGGTVELKNNATFEAYAYGAATNIAMCGAFDPVIDTDAEVTLKEGNDPDTATEVTELTNLASTIGYGYTNEFYSKPYVKITQSVSASAPIEPLKFTVTNIPKGGEKTAIIGNGVDVSYASDKYMVIPDQYAESVTDSESFNYFEGTFQKDTTYYGSALVIPLEDLGGAPNFNITGGTFIKSEATYTADEQPTGEYKVYFSVPVTEDAEVIDTVSFTGVTLPKDGDEYYDVDLSDGEHYSVDDAYWEDEDEDIPDTFELGKDYYLVVDLKPERGYIFADSMTASINGGTAQTVIPDEALGWAEIKIKVSVKDAYTITFNANGGSVTTETALTGTDGKLASLPTPTYSGYKFNGWYTAATGGTKVTADTVFDADTEIFAHWTKKSSGGGGGGSTTYTVTPAKADNGSVTTSPKTASSGSKVKITVTPDEGYKLDTITVTDQNGKEIEVTEKDGEYTFTMPAGKVDVTPVFVKDDSEPTAPPTDPTAPPADNDNPFTDVETGDYFYDAVQWAAKEEITSGTTDTTFSPNDSCTRAQTVTFLWRSAGSPEPTSTVNPFTDVNEGDYFYKAVLWAYENGITLGTSDDTFSPNDTVTRAQTVTFLYRLAGDKSDGENPFTDVNEGDYYYDSVLWAYQNEITGGTSDTTFSPADDCLRAQIVTFLYRCYK